MGKVIAGYFICVNGVIWTVFIEGEAFSSNMDAGIAVVDSKNGDGKEVQILVDDAGETLVHEEYVLWPSLVDLARAIEEQ